MALQMPGSRDRGVANAFEDALSDISTLASQSEAVDRALLSARDPKSWHLTCISRFDRAAAGELEYATESSFCRLHLLRLRDASGRGELPSLRLCQSGLAYSANGKEMSRPRQIRAWHSHHGRRWHRLALFPFQSDQPCRRRDSSFHRADRSQSLAMQSLQRPRRPRCCRVPALRPPVLELVRLPRLLGRRCPSIHLVDGGLVGAFDKEFVDVDVRRTAGDPDQRFGDVFGG